MLASACANGTGVPQVLLDAKAAEVQKRTEAQKAIEVSCWEAQASIVLGTKASALALAWWVSTQYCSMNAICQG